ncbi:MAG: hypothetical protein GKS02_04305 [Alphaproteobacteria bacterium]|nr:hypothetical protein [Alphaproteobacteria bacterium]
MRVPGPALVLPMLLLTGCALPPAVTVASLVLDGVSYVSTGKSTTDHAISALADEDCALLRVVDGKEVCDPNGEVLFALAADDPANENWYLDPETGSPDPNVTTGWGTVSDLEAAVENEPQAQPEVSATSAKNLGAVASATPALTPGPVGQGKNLTPMVTAITIAAKPSPRGLFANARPAPKPEEPQLPIQAVSRFARLTLQDGEVVTYAVIASFQNVENARRMAGARDDDAVIQEIEVKGGTTYRILVDQPLEQAQADGFPDAWPVRLCSGDLDVPPCGQLVVSQAEYGSNTIAN